MPDYGVCKSQVWKSLRERWIDYPVLKQKGSKISTHQAKTYDYFSRILKSLVSFDKKTVPIARKMLVKGYYEIYEKYIYKQKHQTKKESNLQVQ